MRASPIFRDLVHGGRRRKRARALIRLALIMSEGRIDRAAESLGVTGRTLSRWLAEHGLTKFAAQIRAEHHVPGPRP